MVRTNLSGFAFAYSAVFIISLSTTELFLLTDYIVPDMVWKGRNVCQENIYIVLQYFFINFKYKPVQRREHGKFCETHLLVWRWKVWNRRKYCKYRLLAEYSM